MESVVTATEQRYKRVSNRLCSEKVKTVVCATSDKEAVEMTTSVAQNLRKALRYFLVVFRRLRSRGHGEGQERNASPTHGPSQFQNQGTSEPAALDAEQNTTSAIEATTPIFPGDMATAVEENQSPVAEVGDRENVQEMKETLLEHEHASELLVETKHVMAPSAITVEAKYRQAAMDMILVADPLTWTGMELMMASAEANSPYQPPHNCCYMYQEPVDSASFY